MSKTQAIEDLIRDREGQQKAIDNVLSVDFDVQTISPTGTSGTD